jgi:ABC-type enterobactin transport system permease subunit
MEIVLAILAGVGAGLIAQYSLPHRDVRGVALVPAIGGVLAAATWTALTWAGWTTLDPMLWVIGMGVPAVAVAPVAAIITQARVAHDERERARLRLD